MHLGPTGRKKLTVSVVMCGESRRHVRRVLLEKPKEPLSKALRGVLESTDGGLDVRLLACYWT